MTRDALNFSYENHAAWVLEDSMAGSLATVDQMLSSVWQAAVKRVGEEVKEMEEVIAAEGGEAGVEPWDYRFGGAGLRLLCAHDTPVPQVLERESSQAEVRD